MQVISDRFQETAYRLGYKPYDLLPITRESIEQESQSFIKGMSEKERDYYINKKMVTLMQRQNKIIIEVEKQIKKKQFSYKVSGDETSKLHNPAIIKIIEEHEKIIEKNVKFLDTIHRRKEIDKRRQSVSSNSNSRKNDHQFSINRSSVSKTSNKSVQSSKSNRSAASNTSNTSTKAKLLLVREREKEKERLMKELYKQRELENSKKSLKAGEQILRKSQRVKTRSEINKQIVEENRRDLKYLQNTEIKNHFQRLKFKLQKTQQIRVKNAEKKEERFRKSDYREFKKHLDDESKKMLAYRYNDKSKTTSLRIENQQILRKQARNYNKLTETLKLSNAKQNRQMKSKQQQQFLEALRKNEQQRLQTAQLNRYSFQDENRMKRIGKDVNYQITRKNADYLKNKRSLESEAIHRKIKHKFNELSELQSLKKKLDKERSKVIKDLSFQHRTLDAKSNRTKINSFFQI